VAPDALCLTDDPASARGGSACRSAVPDDCRHVDWEAFPVSGELRGGSRCALSRRTPGPRCGRLHSHEKSFLAAY
jgi:hypothetical protein